MDDLFLKNLFVLITILILMNMIFISKDFISPDCFQISMTNLP